MNNKSLESKYFYNKLVDLQCRSRRNNLKIDGIAEVPNESWKQCKEQLQNMFKEKLGVDNEQIKRIHRVKNERNKSKKTKPRTIVCKIVCNNKKLHSRDIFINKHFCHETMQHRKELWEEVKPLRSVGQTAYLNYRSIAVKEEKTKVNENKSFL